ncbi:MAG: hypothetical protein OXG44_01375 [Gammaproteobacteria bacterium]|nr:hypothetical protein [Gammaproteobacteria bacterium]
MAGVASSHVQHFFYSAANSPRIFNTAKVTPRRMVQSQRHMQSGNRYPTAVTNQSEWAEIGVEGSLELADLVLFLASLFPYKRDGTSGQFDFHALAGSLATDYSNPKQWTRILSYNWRGNADSGPDYEADNPILQNLELNYNRRDDTIITAAFAAKQYKRDSSREAAAPAPASTNLKTIRNSDVRFGLSQGRMGDVAYPTSLLSARWSYADLIELVFGANQNDRGWTDFVDADIQPTLNFRFMANDDYLDYAKVDEDTFVVFTNAPGGDLDDAEFQWCHRARFVDVPRGPGAQGNLQEVEISFLPYARVERNTGDLVVTFTAAAGASSNANRHGYRTGTNSFGSGLARKAGNAGYLPTGLNAIFWDDADGDKIKVGTADAAGTAWPSDWEPATIKVGNGSALALTYDPTSRMWETAAVTPNPLAAGAREVTIAWKWTPATYMSGWIKGSGVAAL